MSHVTSAVRTPLVTGGKTYADVTEDISRQVEGPPTREWTIAFTIAVVVLIYGFACVCWTWWEGLGVWGLNKTVGWAWDITNFVWWVGIGHAGTLISAILLLFRQKWRTAVNRAAEAMTIFAVICAASFIIMHMGRPWLAYWALPLPNTFGSLWVNFKSPLVWDVFAISTYFTVSLVFWYMGLLPDLATIRDRARSKVSRYIYGAFSLGWNGSAKDLGSVRVHELDSGWSVDSAGTFGTYDCKYGLCYVGYPGLAHHYLPSLFRSRCYLLGFCHGAELSADYPGRI